jgi:DNA-binding NarL/FixJ family response regulator
MATASPPVTASATAAEPVRVLVVDDHPIVRMGVIRSINADPHLTVCGEAEGMSQALRAIRELRPQLVVSDISLENGSGLELVKELQAARSEVKVLIYSMHDDDLYAERVLRAGAKGYVNKSEPPAVLKAAIQRVLAGGVHVSPRMTDRMLNLRLGGSTPEDGSPLQQLSDRELEVFEQIGHGVTTRLAAERLHLSPKTIETYREGIKAKLNFRNSTELTRHAIEWVLQSRCAER